MHDNSLAPEGYYFDPLILNIKTYELLTLFGASKFIYDHFKSDEFSFEVMKELERSRISELLITVAIISRNILDGNDLNNKGLREESVGSLNDKAIKFREACNKIIHSEDIGFDIQKGKSISDGYLNPIIHLSGNNNNNDWELELRVIDFCACAMSII